jgi:amylosucrase
MSHRMLGGVCYVVRYAGNLAGVRAKIPYFKELGFTCLHIMPLFGYPDLQKDGRCAVTDYGMLMPIFGTIDQLKDPAMELRRNGIMRALDMVINHTSDKHTSVRTRQQLATRIQLFLLDIPRQVDSRRV